MFTALHLRITADSNLIATLDSRQHVASGEHSMLCPLEIACAVRDRSWLLPQQSVPGPHIMGLLIPAKACAPTKSRPQNRRVRC